MNVIDRPIIEPLRDVAANVSALQARALHLSTIPRSELGGHLKSLIEDVSRIKAVVSSALGSLKYQCALKDKKILESAYTFSQLSEYIRNYEKEISCLKSHEKEEEKRIAKIKVQLLDVGRERDELASRVAAEEEIRSNAIYDTIPYYGQYCALSDGDLRRAIPFYSAARGVYSYFFSGIDPERIDSLSTELRRLENQLSFIHAESLKLEKTYKEYEDLTNFRRETDSQIQKLKIIIKIIEDVLLSMNILDGNITTFQCRLEIDLRRCQNDSSSSDRLSRLQECVGDIHKKMVEILKMIEND